MARARFQITAPVRSTLLDHIWSFTESKKWGGVRHAHENWQSDTDAT
jgi:hypothetical protein